MPKKRKLPQPNGRAPLQPNHQHFLDRFLVHYNGTRAAIEAGFSAHSAGSIANVLLNRDDIGRDLIARRSEMAQDNRNASNERIREEIDRVALADMSDYGPMLGDRAPAEAMQMLTRDQSAVIAEVIVEEFRDGRSDHRQVRRTRFKLADKNRALENAARVRGMLIEKHQVKHEHQHLVLVALLDEIDKDESGKPIVPLPAPEKAK